MDQMRHLATQLQKKNPDLAWDDACDQAYRKIAGLAPITKPIPATKEVKAFKKALKDWLKEQLKGYSPLKKAK